MDTIQKIEELHARICGPTEPIKGMTDQEFKENVSSQHKTICLKRILNRVT